MLCSSAHKLIVSLPYHDRLAIIMALLVNIVDSSGAVVADGVVVVGQGSSVEHGGASASAATWEEFWICCCQFSPDRRINFHPKHVSWKKRGNTGVQKVLGTKSILRWINTSAASCQVVKSNLQFHSNPLWWEMSKKEKWGQKIFGVSLDFNKALSVTAGRSTLVCSCFLCSVQWWKGSG